MNIRIMNFVSVQAQLGLLVVLLVAIADFMIGTFIGPQNDEAQAKGFVGYDRMFLNNIGYINYMLATIQSRAFCCQQI
jgi:hypothetical protein